MHLLEFQKKTLRRDGSLLTYLDNDRDSTSAIILIHGWMERKEHFLTMVEQLPPPVRHHRLLIPDLRGHGESSKSKSSTYQVEDYCADILAIVEQEALNNLPLTFIGHSFGGIIALLAAKALEPYVQHVFLLNTNSGQHGHKSLLALITSFFTLNKHLTAYLIQKLGSFTPSDTAVTTLYLDSIRLTPRFVIRQLALETIRRPLAEFLTEVTFPILLITGKLDKLAPPATGVDFRSLTPLFDHVVWQDIGHYAPLVAPERTAQVITQFLEQDPSTKLPNQNLEEIVVFSSDSP